MLNILPQEAMPQASFNATGDNDGILSDVDTSMKYSTDGGASWKNITGTTIELTGVTAANDVKVYKPGNGTTTADSTVQTIDITQAVQPAVKGVDCTTSEQNNGQITGVDNTMEYKLSAASEWMEITGTEVTGLVNGTYDVRVKANGTVLASSAVTITIGGHICVAQGEWQYDANEHWKLCHCGAFIDEAAHTFQWVTDKAAAATEAGSRHEECTVCGYEKAAVAIPATGIKATPSPSGGGQSGTSATLFTQHRRRYQSIALGLYSDSGMSLHGRRRLGEEKKKTGQALKNSNETAISLLSLKKKRNSTGNICRVEKNISHARQNAPGLFRLFRQGQN